MGILNPQVSTQLKALKFERYLTVAQEFHLSVTPLGEDEYLVRTERVAPGVALAEEQVRWRVEDWLAQARQLMNDPLLGVLEGNAAVAKEIFFLPEWDKPISQSSLNLVALGQQLYNALFQGSLRDSWMMAQAIAQSQGQVLRLRLGLKGTRLPRLPWEVLHAGDRPLATGIDVVFSRYQLNTGLMRPIKAIPSEPQQSLKILMVIASPSDQEALELVQEANHLKNELRRRPINGSPKIDLDILEQPGREQLTQALEQGQYQVFHYAGHSNLGESGGDVYLVSNKTGLTETLTGDDLAGLLANNGVKLAVFNSCRGAYTAASNVQENTKDGNLAEALVKRGIPSVLAMAERIPDEVALTLTRLLYRNLNQGYPIDLSLSRARQGLISAYGSNQLYWALPVLYLHSEFNGFLTNIDDAAQTLDQVFAIPAPSERSLASNQDQALFIAPQRRTSSSFLDVDDDLGLDSMGGLPGYDDEALGDFSDDFDLDDPDAEDPSDFIKNLLSRLDTEPVSSEPAGRGFEVENRPRTASDAVDLGLPVPPNPTPAQPRESAATISSGAANQSLSPQSEKPANSPKAIGLQKNPVGFNSWWHKFQHFPRLWMVLGATGILAIALLGFWFFQNQRSPQGDHLPEIPPSVTGSSPLDPNVDLSNVDTSQVTTIAIEQLSQGKIASGQKAVEELLNREALPKAAAALNVVPKSQLDDPTVSFLRGRLAWQSVQKGSRDYDLSDARRYWETAHKKQPNSSNYLTALGFAYYAEGNFERANQAWFDALYLMKQSQGATGVAADTAKRDALTIYAGLAMGLRQSAQKQPADKRASLLNKSIQLRQEVMTEDPVDFQPEALSKNWLWSQKAIQDWRSLLATKN